MTVFNASDFYLITSIEKDVTMVDSVSNAGSAAATQALQSSVSDRSRTLGRLSTGLDVSSARDDAATFAIAQNLSAQTAGLSSVSQSLSRAASQIDVSLASAEQAQSGLNDLRTLALQASDASLSDASRSSLNDAFQSGLSQFSSTISSAEFGDVNVLDQNGGDISAIASADGASVVGVDNLDLSLGGPNIALSDNTSIASAGDAANALAAIDASLETVSSALSTLASTANSIESSQEFTVTLSNSLEEGIGNLVDADLGEIAAQLAADSVAVELGTLSLSIANQSEASVLGLFEDSAG